jgi:hypothetical protein
MGRMNFTAVFYPEGDLKHEEHKGGAKRTKKFLMFFVRFVF